MKIVLIINNVSFYVFRLNCEDHSCLFAFFYLDSKATSVVLLQFGYLWLPS